MKKQKAKLSKSIRKRGLLVSAEIVCARRSSAAAPITTGLIKCRPQCSNSIKVGGLQMDLLSKPVDDDDGLACQQTLGVGTRDKEIPLTPPPFFFVTFARRHRRANT